MVFKKMKSMGSLGIKDAFIIEKKTGMPNKFKTPKPVIRYFNTKKSALKYMNRQKIKYPLHNIRMEKI